MRKRFEQQMTLGRLPISETEVPTKKRSGALPGLCTAMKEIFITTKWNEIVFEILEAKLNPYPGGPSTYEDYHNLWPIPYAEIEKNIEGVLEQNPGYPVY